MEEAVKTVVEKLMEASLTFKTMAVDALARFPDALQKFGDQALAWLNQVVPPETRAEKIDRLQKALKKSGEQALAWLNQVFPPEKRAEWLHAAAPYVVAAVVLVVAYKYFGGRGGGGSVKMMKAPGRNYSIPRSRFEGNPGGYFRDLRARK